MLIRVFFNLGATARDSVSTKLEVVSAGIWAQLYCFGWPRICFLLSLPVSCTEIEEDPANRRGAIHAITFCTSMTRTPKSTAGDSPRFPGCFTTNGSS